MLAHCTGAPNLWRAGIWQKKKKKKKQNKGTSCRLKQEEDIEGVSGGDVGSEI